MDCIDDDTVIIPGHGPLAAQEDMERFRNMLSTVNGRLQAAKAEGTTVEDWVASNPLGAFILSKIVH